MEKNGVTLIEILIAVAIVGVAFLAILSAVQYGNKSTVKISNYSKAMRIAQEFIEEFRHHPISMFLADGDIVKAQNWFEANAGKYCPKSMQSVEAFKKELKSLKFEPQVKVTKSPSEMISNILLKVNIDWKEGDGTTEGTKVRQIRLANAIHNPSAD